MKGLADLAAGLGIAATVRARLRARNRVAVGVTVAALALLTGIAVGGGAAVSRTAAVTTAVEGVALFTLLTGGWVGDELRSGAAVFWVQTPRSPVLLYAVRFAAVTASALLVVAGVTLANAGSLAVLGHGDTAHDLLRGVPGLLLGLLVLGVLIWLAGGWGARGDGWAGVVIGTGLAAVELVARLQPEWLGPLARAADLVGLPLDDLADTATFLAGTGGRSLDALGRVGLWWAAAAAVGALGVARRAGRAAPEGPAS